MTITFKYLRVYFAVDVSNKQIDRTNWNSFDWQCTAVVSRIYTNWTASNHVGT